MVNLPTNAGDAGLVPGSGNKIPHTTRQLSPWDTTTEPALQSTRAAAREAPQRAAHAPQLENPRTQGEDPMQPKILKKRKCLTVSHRLTIFKICLKTLRKQ